MKGMKANVLRASSPRFERSGLSSEDTQHRKKHLCVTLEEVSTRNTKEEAMDSRDVAWRKAASGMKQHHQRNLRANGQGLSRDRPSSEE